MQQEPTPSKCPFNHGATPAPEAAIHIPDRIKRLPVLRGYPVPFFVGKIDGEYDFRLADPEKLSASIKGNLCWVCGETLGRNKSFVIGPMCGITRTSAEPPSHHECAVYSATACPFLTRPNMKRRDHENLKADSVQPAGCTIERNPGCCAVWTTTSYQLFSVGDERGGSLIRVGEPEKVEWFAEGRVATRDEVMESINSGIPILRKMCDEEATNARRASSHKQLDEMFEVLKQYLPDE
jgi:hypothetical protein